MTVSVQAVHVRRRRYIGGIFSSRPAIIPSDRTPARAASGARTGRLSACATHYGSAAIPDETVTTATALCTAGCGYVVATLWPAADDHAADFAARMYGELITTRNGTPALHPEDTPPGHPRSLPRRPEHLSTAPRTMGPVRLRRSL